MKLGVEGGRKGLVVLKSGVDSESGRADSSPEWGMAEKGWTGLSGPGDEDREESVEWRCWTACSTFCSNSSWVIFDSELKSMVSMKETAPI